MNAALASSIRVDSHTLNFNSCKFADNIAHCPSQSQEIHKAYTENKKPVTTMIAQDPFKEPLKGLFLNGLLITREGWTVKFRPEVDNSCQATSIHPLLVQKYNLHTCHLPTPIEMTNANGSPNKQKVTTHVAQIHLQFPEYNHKEYTEELVLELGHNQMLLGIDWLNFHNPEVDWSMSTSSSCTAQNAVPRAHHS